MSRDAARLTPQEQSSGELAPLRTGPWTSSHIARWCGAQQNWDKIHYDLAYARDVAKLPGTIINGALKQHLIVQFLGQVFPDAWIWRIDYRFSGMDLVGQTLDVHGKVSDSREVGGYSYVTITFGVRNVEQGEDNTAGIAVLIRNGRPASMQVVEDISTPPEMHLDTSVREPDPTMPQRVNDKLGARLERVESDYDIDLSRLRLFAEAVGGLNPIHFDPASPAAKAAGGVLATPLFPLHALEAMPGRLRLSTDLAAMGREGVNEVGRHMAGHFGFEIAWNGGNKVQVHSLARAGERVVAESMLAGAYSKVGKVGGRMLFFETLNRYATNTGRPLVTERQVMICRQSEDKETA